MNYTDTHGNPATGVVWSPGPLPGTVWALPYAGAPSSAAIGVHVRKREQFTADKVASGRTRWGFDHYGPLPAKDWHAALGYNPRDVVRNAETLPLDLAA